MKIRKLILLVTLGVFFLVSCNKAKPTLEMPETMVEKTPNQTEGGGYPIWQPRDPSESGYPVMELEPNYSQGPEFSIDRPIEPGDTRVTGTGPANVPILLVDVSEVGLQLGETIIDTDGRFSFELDQPLESGHAIGIQLGDLTGTDLNENDFIYSETYFSRPLVGILFDMVFIQ